MRVEMVPMAQLVLDERNARSHPQRNMDAIDASIGAFGMVEPLVVQRGSNRILGGNGRYVVLQKRGVAEAPVVFVDLDDAKADALAIALNRAPELASWNLEALTGMLSSMSPHDAMTAGFTSDEIQGMLDQHRRPFTAERMSVKDLKPHPRNYRVHSEDQFAHIRRSIEEHGFYRNVVVARDGTVLAGHGVAQTAKMMGLEHVPVIRLDLDPLEPRALKVLTSDNEIGNLAETDDRALTELLKEIMDSGAGLEGTGFDQMQLAALLYVTRPEGEVADMDAAAEWVGMPGFEAAPEPWKLVVAFESKEARDEFVKQIGAKNVYARDSKMASLKWPDLGRDDLSSLKFESPAS